MRPRTFTLAAALAAALPLAPVPARADETPQPTEALKAALGKAAQYESYAFTATVERARPGGRERPQGGGGAAAPIEGRYAREQASWIKSGDTELIVLGDDMVARTGGGQWSRLAEPAGPGQGGQRARGRQQGWGNPAWRLARMTLPHAELAILANGIAEAKAPQADGALQRYTASLQAEAVRRLVPRAGGGRRSGGQDPNAEPPRASGELTVWVDQQGRVTRYEYTAHLKIALRGREFEFQTTRKVQLSGIGETAVEVPEAARKALEGTAPGGGQQPPQDEDDGGVI
ncbi:MAG: hypothetical protein KatS3mg102_1408 [Planctomycetota bacterium]|nr:MAG: hypothetical protein KatS3mg102_1408 [Planctomycetota bacterium]